MRANMPEQLPENLFDVVVRVTFDVDASEAVSYTHLTLPTKRIV